MRKHGLLTLTDHLTAANMKFPEEVGGEEGGEEGGEDSEGDKQERGGKIVPAEQIEVVETINQRRCRV